MGSHNLPSPPAEETKPSVSRKSTSSSTKSVKPSHRAPKKASSSAASSHHHDHITHNSGMDGRHKRVWKACERCRMKKTKCDGEFPCKRCKDDGLVCTAGVRKKVEYKQLPRGYAEVLENTQFALIATVHKLYSMVRSGQQWELGEPELNDRGQPVIHNIAQKLGCIRPNSDIDLPVHSVFPEDEQGMVELARQLEDQQAKEGDTRDSDSPVGYGRTERAPSSELDHSDVEQDYRKLAFGGGGSGSRSGSGHGSSSAMTMSPQSFATSHDFEFSPTQADMDAAAAAAAASGPMFPPHPSMIPSFAPDTDLWAMHSKAQASELTMQFLQNVGSMPPSVDMLNQGLMESDFGTIKPHILTNANSEVMMGMGDPMIYAGYEGGPMGL